MKPLTLFMRVKGFVFSGYDVPLGHGGGAGIRSRAHRAHKQAAMPCSRSSPEGATDVTQHARVQRQQYLGADQQ
ncbi:hypothetical protein N619_29255 [Ectopseudomonas oleovorans]|nr:hypothetical protein N619_29255 [Pseudomonas oleovorans]